MKTTQCIVVIALLMLCPVFAGDASVDSLAGYKLILERNIFDVNRGRPAPPTAPLPSSQPAPAKPPAHHLDLNGILINGRVGEVFVTGAQAASCEVLRLGDKVGNTEIVGVSTQAVSLKMPDGSVLLWPVGMRLVEDGEDWCLEGASPTTKPTESITRDAKKQLDSAAVIKRLMERRKKEQGK
ncbi:MAG: hypothetical protein KAI66_22780 [Lentisphaeria bacterium]|nr:hypothetical protein [Lentisphaeria bacterium]